MHNVVEDSASKDRVAVDILLPEAFGFSRLLEPWLLINFAAADTLEQSSRSRSVLRMRTLFCRDRGDWSLWLRENGQKVGDIWMIFEKGDAVSQSLTCDEALDEALCCGWIDSLIKKIDERYYARRFSRRRDTSKWSTINKLRVERLFAEGRMQPAGIAVVEKARLNGMWDKPDRKPVQTRIPTALQEALRRNKEADQYVRSLTPSHRRRYITWIGTAKREETIRRRVSETIDLLKRKQTLGLR